MAISLYTVQYSRPDGRPVCGIYSVWWAGSWHLNCIVGRVMALKMHCGPGHGI
jgi:hypothetical protein